MENLCAVSHLDADVLLPPRKRLLAGLRRQKFDEDSVHSPSFSGSSSIPPIVETSSLHVFSSSDFNNRLKHLVTSRRNSSNLTAEEIIELSEFEAVSAIKVAEAARAAAEEKAAIAAKAIAAAKSALDFVTSFSEEAASKEKTLEKNKLKKHLPVQLLYKKYQPMENCRTDEELARKLHHVINSSPRISKNFSNSDARNHKPKKPKRLTRCEMVGIACSGALLREDSLPLCNGHATVSKADSESSFDEACSSKEERRTNDYVKSSQMGIDNREAESSLSKAKNCVDISSVHKRKGRVKLKKLPLSICTTKDKAHAKDEMQCTSPPSIEINYTGDHLTAGLSLFPVEPSADGLMPMDSASTCMARLEAPACIKPNKIVQS